MTDEESLKRERSGTTAITVIVQNNQIYCGNVGDSRAVASIGGKAVPLSNDHKPNKKEVSVKNKKKNIYFLNFLILKPMIQCSIQFSENQTKLKIFHL